MVTSLKGDLAIWKGVKKKENKQKTAYFTDQVAHASFG